MRHSLNIRNNTEGHNIESIDAVLSIAKRIGLDAETARPLSLIGREVFLIEPCLVVAKVATLVERTRSETEIKLATHILQQQGPVVPPLLSGDPGPHIYDDVMITFWEYGPCDEASTLSDLDVKTAYSVLFPHLQSYIGPLPDFRTPIRACQKEVQKDQIKNLDVDSIRLLKSEFEVLDQLDFNSIDTRNLQGDPHLRNVVRSNNQLLWLDLKAACTGPVEWDMASLPQPSRCDTYQSKLFVQLKRLRSASVIVWCALKETPASLETEAIRVHLEFLAN